MEKSEIRKIAQSQIGITAAIDVNNRLWAWTQDERQMGTLKLSGVPNPVKSLRNRYANQVFVGRSALFCLGEDMRGEFKGIESSRERGKENMDARKPVQK